MSTYILGGHRLGLILNNRVLLWMNSRTNIFFALGRTIQYRFNDESVLLNLLIYLKSHNPGLTTIVLYRRP